MTCPWYGNDEKSCCSLNCEWRDGYSGECCSPETGKAPTMGLGRLLEEAGPRGAVLPKQDGPGRRLPDGRMEFRLIVAGREGEV